MCVNTVTLSALIRRINRKLGASGQTLRKLRGREDPLLGRYVVANGSPRCTYIFKTHVDVVDFARELGLLAPYERLALPDQPAASRHEPQ